MPHQRSALMGFLFTPGALELSRWRGARHRRGALPTRRSRPRTSVRACNTTDPSGDSGRSPRPDHTARHYPPWLRSALIGLASAAVPLFGPWLASARPTFRRHDQQTVAAATQRRTRPTTQRSRLVLPSERAYQESLARRQRRMRAAQSTARVAVPTALAAGAIVSLVWWIRGRRQRAQQAAVAEYLRTTLDDRAFTTETQPTTPTAPPPSAASPGSRGRRQVDPELAKKLQIQVPESTQAPVLDGAAFPEDTVENRLHRYLSAEEEETAADELLATLSSELGGTSASTNALPPKLVSVANGRILQVVNDALRELRQQSQAQSASDLGMRALLRLVARGKRLAGKVAAAATPGTDDQAARRAAERFVSSIEYAARRGRDMDVRELYRRYAVRVLMENQPKPGAEVDAFTPESLQQSLDALDELQRLLRVDNTTAAQMKDQAARFIFQMAASAAASTAAGDDTNAATDEAYLRALTNLLGGILTPDAADKIKSEVGMMRILYDVEKMIKEGNFTAEDKRAVRQMCQRLGFDVKDILASTAQLKEVLGAEGARYAQVLQQVLGGDDDNDVPRDVGASGGTGAFTDAVATEVRSEEEQKRDEKEAHDKRPSDD